MISDILVYLCSKPRTVRSHTSPGQLLPGCYPITAEIEYLSVRKSSKHYQRILGHDGHAPEVMAIDDIFLCDDRNSILSIGSALFYKIRDHYGLALTIIVLADRAETD